MKPSKFAYFAPDTVDECVALLAEHGWDAKLLAGGQSLVPLMNLRLAAPEVLIDLNRVSALAGIREEGEHLVIGATTSHHEIASSEVVRRACPLLAQAAGLIGYPAIRNRGTIGGSLAHADPASELPCVACTLDAELIVLGPTGRRSVPAGRFFVSHFTTELQEDELLVEVRLPRRAVGDGWEFVEFSRKHGDFALAAAAVDIRLYDGRIQRVRIGIGGVGERPWRAARAEELLAGGEPTAEALERAAESVGDQAAAGHNIDPYRSRLAATLTRRALSRALARTEA